MLLSSNLFSGLTAWRLKVRDQKNVPLQAIRRKTEYPSNKQPMKESNMLLKLTALLISYQNLQVNMSLTI